MSYRLVITDRAFTAIEEAYQWYAARSVNTANRWYNGLMSALKSLEKNPDRFGKAPENDRFPVDLRQMLYGRKRNYRVLFTIRGNDVVILFVRHSSQRLLTEDDI